MSNSFLAIRENTVKQAGDYESFFYFLLHQAPRNSLSSRKSGRRTRRTPVFMFYVQNTKKKQFHYIVHAPMVKAQNSGVLPRTNTIAVLQLQCLLKIILVFVLPLFSNCKCCFPFCHLFQHNFAQQ